MEQESHLLCCQTKNSNHWEWLTRRVRFWFILPNFWVEDRKKKVRTCKLLLCCLSGHLASHLTSSHLNLNLISSSSLCSFAPPWLVTVFAAIFVWMGFFYCFFNVTLCINSRPSMTFVVWKCYWNFETKNRQYPSESSSCRKEGILSQVQPFSKGKVFYHWSPWQFPQLYLKRKFFPDSLKNSQSCWWQTASLLLGVWYFNFQCWHYSVKHLNYLLMPEGK